MKNKERVLLTGGSGFLGSRILKLLLQNDFFVVLLMSPKGNLDKIKEMIGNNRLNIINREEIDLEKLFSDRAIDYIVHTATCYGRNNESEEVIQDVNVDLPFSLLEQAIKNKVKAFINADTFFREDMGLKEGERLYVSTKKSFLRKAKEKIAGTELKFVNLILQQIYGPADRPEKFVPAMMRRLQADSEIQLTPGEQKRDFVYVEDAASAFLSAILSVDKLDQTEEFEIGAGKSYTIKFIVELIKNLLSSQTRLKWGALPYRDNEIMDSSANIEANQKIGWRAKIGLKEGMQKTVNYYQSL